eukprot:6811495-Prymnesium_polylepis.1
MVHRVGVVDTWLLGAAVVRCWDVVNCWESGVRHEDGGHAKEADPQGEDVGNCLSRVHSCTLSGGNGRPRGAHAREAVSGHAFNCGAHHIYCPESGHVASFECPAQKKRRTREESQESAAERIGSGL